VLVIQGIYLITLVSIFDRELKMVGWVFRRRIIIGLTLATFLLVVALQPFFLGYLTYFGVDARLVCCPIAFVVLPYLGIHIYINRQLLKNLFSRRSQKASRLLVFGAMATVGVLDISSGWRSAISGQSEYLLIPMWAWSWIFTMLIVFHIWLHQGAFTKYFRGKKTVTRDHGISSG
jgi:hypothetical protein